MWLPEIASSAGPKYLSISAALGRDIETGRLRPGDRLPPQRDLAEALGIDLGTVTRAYAEARRQGLIDADGRRGSFVREAHGILGGTLAAEQIAPFDTGMNLPPLPLRSSLPEAYAAGLREILAGPAAANRLQYQPAGGAPGDRQAGADWLATRGIAADEDNVLVVSGGQTALHAIAHAALEPGDVVCTGRFAYPGWLSIARRLGLQVLAVDSDAEGIDPAALDRACAAQALAGQPVRALYVVPTNDSPTTATMGVERRRAVAEVARRHELKIIEDDAYGRLAAEPLPPLASLAPERTWHVASLSKIVSPALRVAYLRAPSLRDAWRLAADVHATTVMAPPLNVALATRWLTDGSLQSLVDEVRAECVARRAIADELLPAGSFRAEPEGYHLWIPLPEGLAPTELVSALAPSGLSVVSGEAFVADPADTARAVRVSIGGSLSRERLTRALSLLDALLHHRGSRMTPLV
ncbi:PLP-dependent aminotransferase family protein [Novosphingobium sp. JCM 18896]|uniref:aminotransferase-like domain-containing protein n=1 Tax=Novosphingobium sp. JCM 18896 TaxID=2989731 RepID=UPI0022232CF0|nr:PLP-dependent aminotransferase family protein [Novosphingobium sp. JCM 18896]MCW1431815.1 PLP-dependent aminotransferase family protein [Novosphingobium sp. JCM 18896]